MLSPVYMSKGLLYVHLRVRVGLQKGRDLIHADFPEHSRPGSVPTLLVLGSCGCWAFYRHPVWSSSNIRGVRYLAEATELVKSKPNWDSNLALPKAPPLLLSSPVLKVLPGTAGSTSIKTVFGVSSWSISCMFACTSHTTNPETDSGEEGKHPLGSTCVLGAHTCQLSSWLSKGSQQAKLGILTMTFSLVAQSRRLINPTR